MESGGGERPSPTTTPGDAGRNAPEVEVNHLRASYDRRVFTDVSFTAAPGAVTVVSGPSGIGKSTLVRVLLGRHAPDRGEVRVGGRSVVGATVTQLAGIHARTGFLFSGLDAGARGRKGFDPGGDDDPNDGVAPRRSVADNVRDAATDAGRAERCLADFDLADDAERRAADLDLGARRRLGLARVFAADPDLVLLDDPVAALSAADRDAVVAGLSRALGSSPAGPPTVVLACFDLTTVRQLGDDLVTLISGRVGGQGPVERMLAGIETDHEFATAYSVGGKQIEAKSSDALGEHKTGVGLYNYDQRLFIGLMAGLGFLFLIAIVAFFAFRVLI